MYMYLARSTQTQYLSSLETVPRSRTAMDRGPCERERKSDFEGKREGEREEEREGGWRGGWEGGKEGRRGREVEGREGARERESEREREKDSKRERENDTHTYHLVEQTIIENGAHTHAQV